MSVAHGGGNGQQQVGGYCTVRLAWRVSRLKREEQHESHHEAEETHGFGQRKPDDGVRKERRLEAGVSCVADDHAAEDRSDSGS